LVYKDIFAPMTRESIIQSSKDLFLKYGVKSVSMDDISRLLGISKKTIYNFVTNKKDLVTSVVQAFIDEEIDATQKILTESSNAVDEITSIASFVLKSLRSMKPTMAYDLQKYHPKAWNLVEEKHLEYIKEVIKKNIIRGIDEGLYREEVDPTLTSKMYVGLSRLLVNEEVFPSYEYDKGYVYENFLTYHLHGILNTKGRKELAKQLKNKAA